MNTRFTLEDLSTMSERGLLFKAIKEEMIKRGHWKNKARGLPNALHFTGVNTNTKNRHQVKSDSGFSED